MATPSVLEPESQPRLQPPDPAPLVAETPQPVAETPKPRRVYRGTGLIWALLAALVAATLLVILIAQNNAPVTIHFLWLAPEVSLVVLALASVLLAVCVAEGVGLIWRHRRRERLTQRDELRRIHAAH